MPGKILALHGAYGVGKDTVAEALAGSLPFRRIGFGDGVWSSVAALYDMTEEFVKERHVKETESDKFAIWRANDPDYRSYMRMQGHDLYEARTSRFHALNYGGDFALRLNVNRWVDVLINQLEENPEQDFVVSDLRTYDDLREYSALATYSAAAQRQFMCVEITQEGKSYGANPANKRLPGQLIHATVANERGNLSRCLTDIHTAMGKFFA